ncbi:Lactonase, 7-bladed beta-propeller-domain-containing protein [Infundibulicybe gibba]|nr:Lactonase, 7-bladed beta-propeller-domain-containing protein [Infundibulicybe gibba]
MIYRILVASYTNDISTLVFDSSRSTLTIESAVTAGFHPSWIAFHPSDHSVVFAGLEQSNGKILALKYEQDGKGAVVAEAPSGGQDPCHLHVVKEELVVANYSSGSVAFISVSSKAPYLLSSTPRLLGLEGSGPNKQRQEASHAHQAFFHEQYQELLVPDLGSDRVCRLKRDPSGAWKILGYVQYGAGGGPRHVAFHDGYLYTLLELTSKITRHRFPPMPDEPVFVADAPTLIHPHPPPNDMLAAEILIPAPNSKFPTPYLYVSNRNEPSPDGDAISIFSIAGTDTLELIAEVRTGLRHIRGMVFGGPDDRWLVAGGVNEGGVKVFERVDGGRSLKAVAANLEYSRPLASFGFEIQALSHAPPKFDTLTLILGGWLFPNFIPEYLIQNEESELWSVIPC